MDWDKVDDLAQDAAPDDLDDIEPDNASRTNLGMWQGKPIPADAVFEDDGVTPQMTPTGRIKRKRGPRGPNKGSKAAPVSNTKLAGELLDPMAKIAVALSFTAPTAAGVLIARGEKTANALVALANGHPRMLAALQKATKVGPAADLTETTIMLAIAMSLDLGRIAPDHPLAALTGVADVYAQTHPTDAPTGQQGPSTWDQSPPPFTAEPAPETALDPRHPMYSFQAGRVTPERSTPFVG